MKININNLTLLCKDQHSVCTNCLFEKTNTCLRDYPILNDLCIKLDSIFVKHDYSDLFDL